MCFIKSCIVRTCLHKRHFIKNREDSRISAKVRAKCNDFITVCCNSKGHNDFIRRCKETYRGGKFGYRWLKNDRVFSFTIKVRGKPEYRITGLVEVSTQTVFVVSLTTREGAYKIDVNTLTPQAFECID